MPTYAPHKNKYNKYHEQPKGNRPSRSSSSSLETPDASKPRHTCNTSNILRETMVDYFSDVTMLVELTTTNDRILILKNKSVLNKTQCTIEYISEQHNPP